MSNAEERVYLDWAATAPPSAVAAEAAAAAPWGNANSLSAEGKTAGRALDAARKQVAELLGARMPSEIIFTSGGTEADNMGVRGLALRNCAGNRRAVLVSAIEHHAVLEAVKPLKREGFKVFTIAADRAGIVTPAALEDAIGKALAAGFEPAVVAVQWVNNELGTIQPVADLAAIAHNAGAKFHCDAVQALGKLPLNLEESGVDSAAFSAHKIGAAKGVGALYLRRGVHCDALVLGGAQEANRRGGTSNVAGAASFAAALQQATDERELNWASATLYKELILDALDELEGPNLLAPTLASQEACVPHILSLLCNNLEGETLVQRLDWQGIAASSGSACSTGSLDPSHVITAIGVPKQQAYGSLRLSFGSSTTLHDIVMLLEALPEVLR